MTVLVLATERDLTADRMVRELGQRGVPVVRTDTAWFPAHVHLEATFGQGAWDGTLTVHERTVPLNELRAIWHRSPATFAFPDELSPAERHWANTEARLGIGGVLSTLAVRWVNHPARIADASVKPVQLAIAARCGLQVPDTLITNAEQAVRRFATTGPTVAKALGAPTIVDNGCRLTAFTHLLDPTDLQDLRGVATTTHQFQRWVPKAYEARVIVAGHQVFAASIHAGTTDTYIDWRNSYTDLAYSRPEIPDPVRAGLLRYCRQLDLTYGAFDFVITPDGDWVFLECNPGGQYGWIEDAISAPITAAIADLLTGESPPWTDPSRTGSPTRKRWPTLSAKPVKSTTSGG